MEKEIRTVVKRSEYEKIIEKSKFITYLSHVENEEGARVFGGNTGKPLDGDARLLCVRGG